MSGWRDVEHGRRELDWDVLVGAIDQASCLTEAGRQAVRRALGDLHTFFGPGWLSRAASCDRPEDRIPLAVFSPSLSGPDLQWRGFVELLSLWARLQSLVVGHVAGIGRLRTTLRSNPVRIEFRHAVAQARIGCQARLAGARVMLEPEKPDKRPGDVRAIRGDTDVFFEYRAIDIDRKTRAHMSQMYAAVQVLLRLGSEYGVTWSGELPLIPDEEWQRRVRDAGASTAASGAPTDVVTGGVLRCTAGGAAAAGENGGKLIWPEFDRDQQFRLLSALAKKAERTQAAGAAWIWFEDAGAVWPRTPFATAPISEKIDILVNVLDEMFRSNPHVVGVVLTSGEAEPVSLSETFVDHPRGAGFVRRLPTGQLRESVLVHRKLVVPGQFEFVRRLCETEPTWLNDALVRLDTAPVHRLLATPVQQASSLYLPDTRNRGPLR